MAVAFDATSVGESSSSAELTFEHTCTGANRFLYVGVSSFNAVPTGITYDAVGMIKVDEQANASNEFISIWRLTAPATGANNVVVTFAAAEEVVAGAISFTGVHQTTPIGTAATATANSSTPTVDVSSETGGFVADVVSSFNRTFTVGASQTSRWEEENGGAFESGVGSTEPGAATVTMSWTLSAGYTWCIGALPIKATGNGGPAGKPDYYYQMLRRRN